MTTHYDVAERFAERGRPLRGKSVFADDKQIYSYGYHFPMAYANDEKKLFVINGDTYSHTTSRHQSDVRGAISGSGYRSVSIPFSILGSLGANISLDTIDVIAVGHETQYWACKQCDFIAYTSKSWENHRENSAFAYEDKHKCRYQHLLAPSLVTGRDFTTGKTQYFLSAFDDTARRWNGGYFFSRLPKKATTIEDAYQLLRPVDVLAADNAGIISKRQGDIFAIPKPNIRTRDLKPFEIKSLQHIKGAPRPQLLDTNHYATEARRLGKRLFARGVLYHKPQWREADHRTIKLGNIWHEIFRNTAVGSWSVDGRVD